MVRRTADTGPDQGRVPGGQALHAQAHERLDQLLQPLRVVGADLQAGVRRVDRGPADVELLDLVAPVRLQDLVQDPGEQHGVDNVTADLQGVLVGQRRRGHGSSVRVAGRGGRPIVARPRVD